jgi:hypothetical protein
LNTILNEEKIRMRWDNDRIVDLFEDHLWPYFRTLRDIKRFLGTFDFYFYGQVNRGVLEVNPVDLIILEVLRTFDHEAYLEIRDSFGYLSSRSLARLLYGVKDSKKNVQVRIEAITSRPGLSSEAKDHLGAVLRALFPDDPDTEFLAKAERDFRVCHPSHFPKYFEHTVEEGPTSAANVRALLEIIPRRADFVARLRELCSTEDIHEALEKLRLYFDDLPVDSAEQFIGALFDIGDELPPAKGKYLERETVREAARLVFALLNKLPDNAARGQILLRSFSSSRGVVLPVMVVGIMEPDREKPTTRPSLVDESDLAELRREALARVTTLVTSGGIWEGRHFQLYLYRWRDWAGQAAVNEWLTQELTTPERRVTFVARMLNMSIINGQRIEYSLNGKAIEAFVSLEDLTRDVAGIPAERLDAMAILARTLLFNAAQRKAEGKSYNEVHERGDFGV